MLHCRCKILLKSDIICLSYTKVHRGLLFPDTVCIPIWALVVNYGQLTSASTKPTVWRDDHMPLTGFNSVPTILSAQYFSSVMSVYSKPRCPCDCVDFSSVWCYLMLHQSRLTVMHFRQPNTQSSFSPSGKPNNELECRIYIGWPMQVKFWAICGPNSCRFDTM